MDSSNLQEFTTRCWNLTKSNRSHSYGLWGEGKSKPTHSPDSSPSVQNTADAWWELCSTNRSSGTGGWREMGRKKRGKTATEESKSNITMLFLSPSANLTPCCISTGWESEHHIFHLDNFNAFPLDEPVVSLEFNELISVFVKSLNIIALDNNLTRSFQRAMQVENALKLAEETNNDGKRGSWLYSMSKFSSTLSLGEYEADISATHHWTVGRQPCLMRVVGEGKGWWHSLSHHRKMKINYWKPERQPNGKSLQTWRAQSCKLRVAKALSPHALSAGPTIRPEECDDMTEGVRACFPTGEAPGTEEHHPFEGLDCYHHSVN